MLIRTTIHDPLSGPITSTPWDVTVEEGHIGAARAAWVRAYGRSPGHATFLIGRDGSEQVWIEGVQIDTERLEFGEPRTMVKKRPHLTIIAEVA